MFLIILSITNIFLASFLVYLWLNQRQMSYAALPKAEIEFQQHGKISYNGKISDLNEITQKLYEIGELKKNVSGYWIWSKSGKRLGAELLSQVHTSNS